MGEKTWSAVEDYFDGLLLKPDPVLDAALATSAAAGLPAIQVSAAQGAMLQTLALAQGSRRILEVGTLGGYSTLWLARALPPEGCVVTLERESRHAEVARRNFVRAGIAARIDVQVGPALDTLASLRAQRVEPFDFVFIDADKRNNLGYVQAALELSRVGTLIVVDNVVRAGAVIAKQLDTAAEGVRRMVEWIAKEPRLKATVIQTVGDKGYDGFLLARVQISDATA